VDEGGKIMIAEKELKELFLDGLTKEEAERRLKKYGPNQLEKKKSISKLKIFIYQFNDFITWILIAATIISGLMGEKADAITILIIIVMNAILGFVQEYKTERSLEALKAMAAPTAKVKRDGRIQVITAENIVIGDIVVLEAGDRIPADCELLQVNNVMVDESLLTGESTGVAKSLAPKENYVYMGSILLTGKAVGRVIQTGMNTEMGKIANMLQSIEEERSPLKERLAAMGKILVIACIAICILVTVLGIIRGNRASDMFLLGVSLAVAAIPEGLAAIVTIALALGVSRMLKRNALVRKLPAVETLGCTSIICSDKTGTLTENKMTVKAFYFDGKIFDLAKDEKHLPENIVMKKIFTYCNDSIYNPNIRELNKSLTGDPTETALIKAYFKEGKELDSFISKGKRVFEVPFDSNRKMMSVVTQDEKGLLCYTKGAPERIIEKCSHVLINGEIRPLNSLLKNKIMKSVEEMSNNALRCIAAAYKESGVVKSKSVENNLIFVGVAGIIDPPRKEVKDAVLKCRIAGIRPVMITGDHKNTAFAIGRELDICSDISQVITGEEIDRFSDKELEEKVDRLSIFARVSPNHKLRIVRAFKSKKRIVAMTGDGVNDAPAVKEADIGISMGISGTDVTKEASSMILMDDNFATIVAAVEEGRVIYDNIRKFIRYLLSCNLGEVLTMFLATLFYLPAPLMAIQILFVNLATDGLPAIALGVDPADKDIMLQRPRPKNESVFARGLIEKIILRGSLIGICTVTAFILGKYWGMSLEACRTLALSTLVLSQLLHVFECRSEKHSIFEINLFSNMYLVAAVCVSITMLLSILYIPFLQAVFHTVALNLTQWIIVIFFSGIIFMINSLYLLIKR
jgi:Ca2+-transporting ATPase